MTQPMKLPERAMTDYSGKARGIADRLQPAATSLHELPHNAFGQVGPGVTEALNDVLADISNSIKAVSQGFGELGGAVDECRRTTQDVDHNAANGIQYR